MRLEPILAVLLWAPLAGEALAQTRQVCLDDQAGLNAPTIGSFHREFQFLVGARGIRLEDEGCAADAIRISVHRNANGHPSDALGAAPIADSGIGPRLEIYFDRIVALMPETQCWNVVGRALARVAAHEVAHYIDQDESHSEAGLLQAKFSGTQLAGEDSYPFRWIPPATKLPESE